MEEQAAARLIYNRISDERAGARNGSWSLMADASQPETGEDPRSGASTAISRSEIAVLYLEN